MRPETLAELRRLGFIDTEATEISPTGATITSNINMRHLFTARREGHLDSVDKVTLGDIDVLLRAWMRS